MLADPNLYARAARKRALFAQLYAKPMYTTATGRFKPNTHTLSQPHPLGDPNLYVKEKHKHPQYYYPSAYHASLYKGKLTEKQIKYNANVLKSVDIDYMKHELAIATKQSMMFGESMVYTSAEQKYAAYKAHYIKQSKKPIVADAVWDMAVVHDEVHLTPKSIGTKPLSAYKKWLGSW